MMNRSGPFFAAVVLAVCPLATGAEPATTQPAGKAPAATTPKQALLNMYQAMFTGERALAVATIEVPAKDREHLFAMIDRFHALANFIRKMRATYEEEDVTDVRLQGPMTMEGIARKIETDVTFNVSGDTATMKMKGTRTAGHLIRLNGLWKFAMEADALKPEALWDNRAHARALRAVEGLIGKPGMTPRKIMAVYDEKHAAFLAEQHEVAAKAEQAPTTQPDR